MKDVYLAVDVVEYFGDFEVPQKTVIKDGGRSDDEILLDVVLSWTRDYYYNDKNTLKEILKSHQDGDYSSLTEDNKEIAQNIELIYFLAGVEDGAPCDAIRLIGTESGVLAKNLREITQEQFDCWEKAQEI